MRRREFIAGIGSAAVWPLVARAQQPVDRRPLIGMLLASRDASSASPYISAFSESMSKLGWTASRNYDTVYKYSAGEIAPMGSLARDLVLLEPSVIATGTTIAARAVRAETTTIPIVCSTLVAPIELGLATSLSRPGGNVTGTLYQVDDLQAKQLELTLEVIPGVEKVGTLSSSVGIVSGPFQLDVEPSIAAHLRIATIPISIQRQEDLEAAFDAFTRNKVQAVVVYTDPLLAAYRAQVASLALRHKLPLLAGYRDFVDAGGVFSYGVNLVENFRRIAAFTDKILRGTNPGDIPIEFPTKLEMVINLRTAKTLGLTIPPSLLARADEVIE